MIIFEMVWSTIELAFEAAGIVLGLLWSGIRFAFKCMYLKRCIANA